MKGCNVMERCLDFIFIIGVIYWNILRKEIICFGIDFKEYFVFWGEGEGG